MNVLCYDLRQRGNFINLKQKLLDAVCGFFVGIFILSAAIFGLKFYSEQSPNNVSFDEAVRRINSREIKKVNIKSERVELVNQSDTILFINDVTESQTDQLTKTVFDFNQDNFKNSISLSVDPKSFDPMPYLFQILLWLFYISPPLIVVMLFLIWRELKARNNIK